jgi:hypothetical protein
VYKKSPLSAFLAAILIGGLVLAIAMRFGTVHASTDVSGIPKPSVPEFTLKFVIDSRDVAPTTTIDPYTGKNITHPGYVLYYRTIEITVKNQPFSPYTDANGNYINVYYNVSFKGHYEDTWSHYPDSTYVDLFNASASEYTVISMSLGNYPSIRDGSQLDFRLEALIGHYNYNRSPAGTNYVTGFSVYETSGWSSTQTITLGESQTPIPSPATTPTPTAPNMGPTSPPSQEPALTQEQLETIIGAAIAVAVIGAGVGLLIYLIKRK